MRLLLALGGAFTLGVFVLATPAVAITYTNVTTGQVVFADDYESVSAIGVGFDDDPGTTDFDPLATIGTWTTTEEAVEHVQVTSFEGETTGSVNYPGAFQGDNYLWLDRTGSFNKAVGTPTSAATIGQEIHIEWMAYIRANTAGNLGVFSLYNTSDASGDRIAGISVANDGAISNGGSLTWAPDTWQKWEFDYVVGSETFDLTVGGTQETGIELKDAAAASGPADSIRFGSRVGVQYLVDAVRTPLQLEVNRSTGRMQIANRAGDDWSTYFYRISGELDSLDPVGWNSLDEQDYDAIGSGTGESWDEAGGSDTSVLAEAFLLSGSTFSMGDTVSLGVGYDAGEDKQGLVFEYRDADTRALIEGTVNYILPGDMNNDGEVNALDVNPFVQALTDPASFEIAHSDVDADFIGDFNGNGRLDLGDLSGFKAAVVTTGSASSLTSSVPEPSAALLLFLASLGLVGSRNPRLVARQS